MKQLSQIVWNEGMHLAQHHFQAQSRFFEDSVQFALTSLFFKPYGLVACELDVEALRNDTVSLVHARGIMPDGLPFDIPASDPSLAALPIRERFSPTSDSHLVLLGIPAYRPDQANFATNGGVTVGEPHHAVCSRAVRHARRHDGTRRAVAHDRPQDLSSSARHRSPTRREPT